MTAGNEEERGEERRMEERGEENRRGAGTRCAEIKEIKENDFSKKRDNSWIEMQLEFAYVWWMCWWRVRIRDGWGGGLGVDGFQCSWKQLRKTQGPGSHSPNRLVSVTYSSQHLNLTPTHTHTERQTHKHTQNEPLYWRKRLVYLSHQRLSSGAWHICMSVCVCVFVRLQSMCTLLAAVCSQTSH